MVELLVVIAVIAILAAILIPTVGKGVRTARETKCAADLGFLTKSVSLYALDNEGALPDITKNGPNGSGGGPFSYWTWEYWTDWFKTQAGVPRDNWYSASNKKWNRDDFWDWPSGTQVVTGRFYFGVPAYNTSATFNSIQGKPSGATMPMFPVTSEGNSSSPMLFADLNRQYPAGAGDNWVSPGDPNRWGSNHLYPGETWPTLNHIAHIDGSVHRIPGSKVVYRLTWGGSEIYW